MAEREGKGLALGFPESKVTAFTQTSMSDIPAVYGTGQSSYRGDSVSSSNVYSRSGMILSVEITSILSIYADESDHEMNVRVCNTSPVISFDELTITLPVRASVTV